MGTDTDVRKASNFWKLLAAVVLAVAGAVGGGLASRGAGQATEPERIRAVEVRQDAIEMRLERMDSKLDRLLERK